MSRVACRTFLAHFEATSPKRCSLERRQELSKVLSQANGPNLLRVPQFAATIRTEAQPAASCPFGFPSPEDIPKYPDLLRKMAEEHQARQSSCRCPTESASNVSRHAKCVSQDGGAPTYVVDLWPPRKQLKENTLKRGTVYVSHIVLDSCIFLCV